MIKVAVKALDAISSYFKEHPTAASAIIGGGLGAAGGLLATGKGDEDETTGQRLKRRLKNALIGGGLGAGAGALLHSGVENVATVMPKEAPTPEERIGKMVDTVVNPYTGALAAGGGTLLIGNKLRNMAQKDLPEKIRQLVGKNNFGLTPLSEKATMSQVRAAIPEMIAKVKSMNGGKLTPEFKRGLRQMFGAREGKIKGAVDLVKKLQNYGISTHELESIMGRNPRLAKVIKKTQPLKFFRRNKWTAIPAVLAALGTGAYLEHRRNKD